VSGTIDHYCERTDPSFWAEPLNAVSNGAFLLAAIAVALWARRRGRLDLPTGILAGLTFVIGIGSFAFHTLATRGAMLADVLPILAYQVAFIALYLRLAARASLPVTAAVLALFFGLGAAFGQIPREVFNGSLGYAPAFIVLIGLAFVHRRIAPSEPMLLFAAAGVFTVSLTFRSVDMAVCETFPTGTHVFWHLLNGIVLYLSTRAFVLARGAIPAA